jgi:hypothetical protein
MAHRLLDEQVAASRMSRGDYIEYLLREKGGVVDTTPQAASTDTPQIETVAPQTSFAPPSPEVEVAEVAYIQPVQPMTSDWSNN